MGEIRQAHRVLRVAAVFTRYPELFEVTRSGLQRQWGPVSIEWEPFLFDYTTYYDQEMGTDLYKCFWAFGLEDAADLADWKRASNQWEQQWGAPYPEPRAVNIDPGYVTEAKLVLATTKDRDHRVYLRDGIFAEVTLHYHGGQWRTRPWTYPDYADPKHLPFFEECRKYLRSGLRADGSL